MTHGTQTKAADLAVRELLGFPACWIAELPAPTSMLWRAAGSAGLVLVSTSERRRQAASGLGAVAFAGPELAALIVAAENDRATSGVLAQWCAWKRSTPTWRLDAAEALGGICSAVAPQGWMLERVLRAYGAELVAVGVGDGEVLG